MRSPALIRRLTLAVFLLLATLVLTLTAGVAPAQSSFGSFSVSARSDLFRLEVFDDRIPVFPAGQAEVELSPATTQAVVDSLGSSRAFASAPYPGESVAGLPGLIGGLGGGELPPLPRYPVLVSSDFPTQESDRVDQGIYVLEAASGRLTSRSRAQFGGGTGEAYGLVTGRSVSEVVATDDAVTSRATAEFTGLELPGILEVGSFTSSATITIKAGSGPVAETTFDAPIITVAGVGLRLGPDGLQVVDSILPFDLTPVADLLAGAGVQVEYVPARTGQAEDGSTFARSAGMVLVAEVEGPDGNKDTVRYELGRAFATADARPVPALELSEPAGPDPAVPTPAASTTPPDDGTSTGGGAGVAVSPPTPASPSGASTGAPQLEPPAVAGPAPEPPPATTVAAGPIDPGPTLAGFYPMLVLASLVALGAGRLFGLLGVRLRLANSTTS